MYKTATAAESFKYIISKHNNSLVKRSYPSEICQMVSVTPHQPFQLPLSGSQPSKPQIEQQQFDMLLSVGR